MADDTTNTLVIGQGEFHMIVAARIRPFNKKEVKEYRNKIREAKMKKKSQATNLNGNRTFTRNPFGLDQTGRDLDLNNNLNQLLVDSDDEDDNMMPTPIMDVEDHNTTIILYDPNSVDGNAGNVNVAKAQFHFDRVFSSFAPTVEVDLGFNYNNNHHVNGKLPTVRSGDKDLFDYTYNGEATKKGKGGRHNNNEDDTACIEDDSTSPELKEAEQQELFNFLGKPLIEKAFQGYNCCVLAYGQTGSGKTYTMMGNKKHIGLIPRLCHDLFTAMEEGNTNPYGDEDDTSENNHNGNNNGLDINKNAKIKIEVSFMEIYNEQVRDLLKQRPKNVLPHFNSRFDKKDVDFDEYQNLKVRNHPKKGPFVEGLTTVPVTNWATCKALLHQGGQYRTQASTAMNANSSRSHSIFQLVVTQIEKTGKVRGKSVNSEKVSKINLVDLAGSERQQSAMPGGSNKTEKKHVTEANSINVSLSTLRRVIEGLTKMAGKGEAKVVIPYRESLLTYVLADNFGGNSLTVMCANISPSENNVNETESTLRYATLARNVQNRVKINETPQAKIIRELKEQMKGLQDKLVRAPSPTLVKEYERDLSEKKVQVEKMERRQRELSVELQEKTEQETQRQMQLLQAKKNEEKYKKKVAKEKAKNERLREMLKAITADNPEIVDDFSITESMLEDSGAVGGDGDSDGSEEGKYQFPSDELPALVSQRNAKLGKKKKKATSKKSAASKKKVSPAQRNSSVALNSGGRSARSQSNAGGANSGRRETRSKSNGGRRISASSPAAGLRRSSNATPEHPRAESSGAPTVSPRHANNNSNNINDENTDALPSKKKKFVKKGGKKAVKKGKGANNAASEELSKVEDSEIYDSAAELAKKHMDEVDPLKNLKGKQKKTAGAAPLSLLTSSSPLLESQRRISAEREQENEDDNEVPSSAPARTNQKKNKGGGKKSGNRSNPHKDDEDDEDSRYYGNGAPSSAPVPRGKYQNKASLQDDSPVPLDPSKISQESTGDFGEDDEDIEGELNKQAIANINQMLVQMSALNDEDELNRADSASRNHSPKKEFSTEAFLMNAHATNDASVNEPELIDSINSTSVQLLKKGNGGKGKSTSHDTSSQGEPTGMAHFSMRNSTDTNPTNAHLLDDPEAASVEGDDEVSMSLLPQEAAMATRRPQRNSIVSSEAANDINRLLAMGTAHSNPIPPAPRSLIPSPPKRSTGVEESDDESDLGEEEEDDSYTEEDEEYY